MTANRPGTPTSADDATLAASPSFAGTALLHRYDPESHYRGDLLAELDIMTEPAFGRPAGVLVGPNNAFVPATGDAADFLRSLVAVLYSGWMTRPQPQRRLTRASAAA